MDHIEGPMCFISEEAIFLDLQQLAQLIILGELELHLLENGPRSNFKINMIFARYCNVVIGFVLRVLEIGTAVF